MFHLEVAHLYPPDISSWFSLGEGSRHKEEVGLGGGGSLCHIKGETCAQLNLKDLLMHLASALVTFPFAAPFRKCQML